MLAATETNLHDGSSVHLSQVDILHDILCKLSAEDFVEGVWHLIYEDGMKCVPDFEADVHALLKELNSYDAMWDAIHVFNDCPEELPANPIPVRGRHGSDNLRHVRHAVGVRGGVALLVHGSRGAQRLLRVVIDDSSSDIGVLFDSMCLRARMYVSCAPLLLVEPRASLPFTLRTISGQWHHLIIGGIGSRKPIPVDLTVAASKMPLPVQRPQDISGSSSMSLDMRLRCPGAKDLEDSGQGLNISSHTPTMASQREHGIDIVALRRPLAGLDMPDDSHDTVTACLSHAIPGVVSLKSRRPGAFVPDVGTNGSRDMESIRGTSNLEQRSFTKSWPRVAPSQSSIPRPTPSLDRVLDDAYRKVLWQAVQTESSHSDMVARVPLGQQKSLQEVNDDPTLHSDLTAESGYRVEDRAVSPRLNKSIAMRARAIGDRLRSHSRTERAMEVLTGSKQSLDPQWRADFNLTDQGRLRSNVVRL